MSFNVDANPTVRYEILHEESDLLVVNKPAGVVTQPGKKHERDSLLNGLFVDYGNALQNMGEARGWGLLHRLDKMTSGLVLVALRIKAYDHLREQFKQRLVKKTYWAIVSGCPKPARGVIQKPIAEIAGRTRKKSVIKKDGQQAITAYRVLESAAGVSLIEATPKTGRLHQIRVHMAALGHPVLGDSIYVGKEEPPAVPRLCLHAAVLSFVHPDGNSRITVHSPCPTDLARALRRLGLPVPK